MKTFQMTGRLTSTPELETAKSGILYTRLRVASSSHKGKTEYFTVTVFNEYAESCSASLVKGQQVSINGHLSTREVTLENGARINVPSLIADEVGFGMRPRHTGEEE